MSLPSKFESHIDTHFPFLKGKKLLLACSGGMDSVVLTHLMHAIKMDFALAHCNFSLRGKESDKDEMFVVGLGKHLGVRVFVETFDTFRYSEEHKVSIQLAARQLRYDWFAKLLTDFNYDYVLTAHHLDDDFETFLINLSRGTGIRGLTGIPEINQNIVRPLLDFSHSELHQWALSQSLKWREDKSNEDTDYFRNKIRLTVVPRLKEAKADVIDNFKTTRNNLKVTERLLSDYMELIARLVVTQDALGFQIDVEKLKNLPNTKALLYELLHDYGFTQWEDIYGLLDAQTGKIIYSASHRLIRNRSVLLLTEIPKTTTGKIIDVSIEGITSPITLSFSEVNAIENKGNKVIYVDADSIQFPLQLRKKEMGDYFYPFGMRGKKKLSKYFKDERLSIPEKENTWILCSDNKIVWIVGYRMDNRFRVTEKSNKIIRIEWKE